MFEVREIELPEYNWNLEQNNDQILLTSSGNLVGKIRLRNDRAFIECKNNFYFIDADTHTIALIIKSIKNNVVVPKELPGSFNVVKMSKVSGKIALYNDHFGLRKLFVKFSKNVVVVCDCLTADDGLCLNSQLDYNLMMENPRSFPFGETFVDNIFIAPSGCTSMSTNLLRDKYTTKHVGEFINHQSAEDLHFEIIKHFEAQRKNDNVLVHLSGGVDSRFVVECYLEAGASVEGLIYGIKDSVEVQTAHLVAEACGIKVNFVELNPADFINNAERYIFEYAGMDLFSQSYVYKIYEYVNLNRYCYFDTGFILDAVLGGSNLNYDKSDKNSSNDSDRVDIDFYNRIFNERILNNLSVRQNAHRKYLGDSYAFMQQPLLNSIKRLDPAKIVTGDFYSDLLNLACVRTSNIPIANTLSSISATDNSRKITLQKYQDIVLDCQLNGLRITNGLFFSDYTRWILFDQSWLSFQTEMSFYAEKVGFLVDHWAHFSQDEAKVRHLRKYMKLLHMTLCHKVFQNV